MCDSVPQKLGHTKVFLKTLRNKLGLSHLGLDFSKNIEKIWNIAKFRKKSRQKQQSPKFFYLKVFRWKRWKDLLFKARVL